MLIKDKVFVVTGGGSGIGRELVLLLLEKEGRVAAVDIDEAAMKETADLAGEMADRLSLHRVNIADLEEVSALPDKVLSEHGEVDGVINNAGIIQPFVRLHELEYEAARRVMDVNFYGTLYMTKAFLPHLLERPEAYIANVSSMGGFLPVPGQSLYGASKAAVKLLTEALHSELTNTNVEVTVIFPGAIGTNIAENSGVRTATPAEGDEVESSFDPMEPSKAAHIIVEGIEKDRYRVLVGSDAKFMDFIYRLSPKFAARYIFNQMKSLLGE